MYEEIFINRVKTLIENYSFNEPFANYLKAHFRRHPEMGARDRRDTREWTFNYFRLGKALPEISFEKKLAVAGYLCSKTINTINGYLIKTYSDLDINKIENSVEEKLKHVTDTYSTFNIDDVFQMQSQLSPSLDKKKWCLALINKPRVWIRIRKKFKENVLKELNDLEIPFKDDVDPLTISFNPSVSLEKTISFQKGYFEIQDKSSQQTKNYFNPHPGEKWWDACAGSGGKSLLLIEQSNDVKIFATDTRAKILENYSARLLKTGFKNFKTEVTDFSNPSMRFIEQKFNGIIADVPCSGSGTWSRSPEWLQKNISNNIDEYFVPLQRKIIASVLPSLLPGFPLIYITCSVFKKENEENIQFFIDQLGLKLEKSTYLDGSGDQADTLFVARFLKDR